MIDNQRVWLVVSVEGVVWKLWGAMSDLAEMLEPIVRQYLLPIGLFYFGAYVIHRLSNGLSRRLRPLGIIKGRANPRRYERQRTLQALISNATSIGAFISATLLTLGLFVDVDTIVWVVGLFSAAFGLGARPFISDYLTGLSFIFEDTFDVGDKIEIPLFPQTVEGVVESVTLRVTRIRGMEGELFTMPNGDIRLVRNFSRGKFSSANVTLMIPSKQLRKTLEQLEALSEQSMTLLPNLIEPWQVVSRSGELSDKTELTIIAKAKFGKGAVLRTRLLALLQDTLRDVEIQAPSESDLLS